MKKLTYLASAIATAFSASAYADVSVSGSTNVGYLSDVTGDGRISIGSTVDFALSTTTANGIGMSTGLSITVDQDADNAAAAGGGQSVTFTTGGASITVGDIELGDTPGSVGGTVGNLVGDVGQFDSDVKTGFSDDDGTGVSISTALGAATLTVGYIVDDGANNSANITDATDTMSAFGVSMPFGAYTINAGIADHDNGENASGASVTAALGGGTLTLGYSQQTLNAASDGVAGAGGTAAFASAAATVRTVTAVTASADDLSADGDTTVMGATYSMSLDADTSIAVGYQSAKDADSDSTTRMDLSLSRSLGGGASVYLDVRTLSGDTDADGDGTAIGFGTSVAF